MPRFRRPTRRPTAAAAVLVFGLVSTAGASATSDTADRHGGVITSPSSPVHRVPANPGSGPWSLVPASRVAAECGLSPKLLTAADKTLGNTPYAIYRYGKLCWTGGDKKAREETHAINSETKTVTALLFGIIATRTDIDENSLFNDVLPPTWYAEDPFSLVLAAPPKNPNAKIFHTLTQTGQNPDLD
jgi:hypothetical protein